jgi:hypothetical protein
VWVWGSCPAPTARRDSRPIRYPSSRRRSRSRRPRRGAWW